jgi:nucleotide-binding universal stress UspA family protein
MEHLKILIPTDFSVQAEYAYLMVKKLEQRADTEVHFLHVLDVPDTVTIDKKGNIQTCGEIDRSHVTGQKQIAERKLANLKTLYGQHIHTHLEPGKITDTILAFSKREKFDLIVMGTKGAWGLKERLSGTETQMIARRSEIPLLSLMCDRSELVIRNILHVHDFRKESRNDLALLKKFVGIFNARIHQLQIVSNESLEEKQKIFEAMDRYAKINGLVNYENHIIKDSHVENGVVHFNQMHEVDVVCIGTHGKGSLFHVSATEKLINHLYKPIISFHI